MRLLVRTSPSMKLARFYLINQLGQVLIVFNMLQCGRLRAAVMMMPSFRVRAGRKDTPLSRENSTEKRAGAGHTTSPTRLPAPMPASVCPGLRGVVPKHA